MRQPGSQYQLFADLVSVECFFLLVYDRAESLASAMECWTFMDGKVSTSAEQTPHLGTSHFTYKL